MAILYVAILITLAAAGATDDTPTEGYTGQIVCFSDSVKGTKMAESAARYLSSRGEENYYSRSFVASGIEEDGNNTHLLILILSPEGERAFERSRKSFEESLMILLRKMTAYFGNNRATVILQKQDKSNLMEASFSSVGGATVKNLLKSTATPKSSVSQ